MTDEELFELVRNTYAEANKDYLAEQIEIAKQNIDDCDLNNTLTKNPASLGRNAAAGYATVSTERQVMAWLQHGILSPMYISR